MASGDPVALINWCCSCPGECGCVIPAGGVISIFIYIAGTLQIARTFAMIELIGGRALDPQYAVCLVDADPTGITLTFPDAHTDFAFEFDAQLNATPCDLE